MANAMVDLHIETDEVTPGSLVAKCTEFLQLVGTGESSEEAATDLADKAGPILERLSGAKGGSTIRGIVEYSKGKN